MCPTPGEGRATVGMQCVVVGRGLEGQLGVMGQHGACCLHTSEFDEHERP